MKKLFKILVSVLALSAISVTVICCGIVNSLKQKICEHEFGKSVIVVEATCTTKGQAKKICSICGYEELEETTTTHKNLVYDDGFPATCEEEGLTYGYYCEDCGFVEGMVTIDKLPHTDENNDGMCDNCPTNILGLKTEIAVQEGDSVVNRWLRIYRTDTTSDFRAISLDLPFYETGGKRNGYLIVCDYGSQYENNIIFDSGPLYSIEGLIFYGYEDYIEVYFKEGTYNVLDNNSNVVGTITIDSSLIFKSPSGNMTLNDCYFLV